MSWYIVKNLIITSKIWNLDLHIESGLFWYLVKNLTITSKICSWGDECRSYFYILTYIVQENLVIPVVRVPFPAGFCLCFWSILVLSTWVLLLYRKNSKSTNVVVLFICTNHAQSSDFSLAFVDCGGELMFLFCSFVFLLARERAGISLMRTFCATHGI